MMPVIEIIRLEECFDEGTLGVLKINKEVFCVTLEPPDKLNQRNISCIPAQQYTCTRYVSQKHGETFIVENVPGRDAILLHPGYDVLTTKGCILLGAYFEKLRKNRHLRNSGETFKKFMETMKGYDRFHLTIREVY